MFNLNALTPAYAFESLSFGTNMDKWLVRVTDLMQKLTADVSGQPRQG